MVGLLERYFTKVFFQRTALPSKSYDSMIGKIEFVNLMELLYSSGMIRLGNWDWATDVSIQSYLVQGSGVNPTTNLIGADKQLSLIPNFLNEYNSESTIISFSNVLFSEDDFFTPTDLSFSSAKGEGVYFAVEELERKKEAIMIMNIKYGILGEPYDSEKTKDKYPISLLLNITKTEQFGWRLRNIKIVSIRDDVDELLKNKNYHRGNEIGGITRPSYTITKQKGTDDGFRGVNPFDLILTKGKEGRADDCDAFNITLTLKSNFLNSENNTVFTLNNCIYGNNL